MFKRRNGALVVTLAESRACTAFLGPVAMISVSTFTVLVAFSTADQPWISPYGHRISASPAFLITMGLIRSSLNGIAGARVDTG
jgi:hypothetical protein